MRIVAWTTVVVSGAFLLSGCQVLGIHHVARASAQPETTAAAALVLAGSNLQIGRDALTGNRPAAAIDAFNLALASGEEPAAAYNGLGVAYSRVGRTDLAYRFFKKARMSDPTNPVYAHNLALLMNSPSFTLQLLDQPERPATQLIAPSSASASATNAKANGAHLVRDSGRQFSLVTIDPSVALPGATRSAAADQCVAAKRNAACTATRLPKTASRSSAKRSNAVAVAGSPQPSAAPAIRTTNDQPAPAAGGKRKIVDLSAAQLQQSAPEAEPVAALANRKI